MIPFTLFGASLLLLPLIGNYTSIVMMYIFLWVLKCTD